MNNIRIYIVAISLLTGITLNATNKETVSVSNQRVIVGNDTVNMLLSDKSRGRFDRGLYNYLYIPKKEVVFGLSASYGDLNTDDVQLLSVLTDVDCSGQIFSIKPWVSYFFKNNQSVGLRLNYTNGSAHIGNFNINLGDGLDFKISDVNYDSNMYGASIFYRNYIGLNEKKRFALFYETDLSYLGGISSFKRYYDNNLNDTRTIINEGRIGFSPGLCVFIHENVAFNIAFDILGLYIRNESQKTTIYDGNGDVSAVETGSYFTGGASFKFNLFSINFGLGFNF